jgi:hypothetical protein
MIVVKIFAVPVPTGTVEYCTDLVISPESGCSCLRQIQMRKKTIAVSSADIGQFTSIYLNPDPGG